MKKSLIIFFLIWLGVNIYAQEKQALNDYGRIVLNTYLYDNTGIDGESKNFLKVKLDQIASEYGLGGSEIYPRFIITANILTGTKDIVPGPPEMIVVNFSINLFIADGIEGTIFSNVVLDVKGVGTNENKAYISGVKNLNPKNSNIKDFIDKGKIKIIDYFNSNCDLIIKNAETSSSQKKYEEALFILNSIPEVCKDCYFKALDKSVEIFQKYVDNKCSEDLVKARAAWAQYDEDKAINYLSEIFPDSKCYDDGLSLVKEIKDHKCASSLGKAQSAWANLDSDLAAKYLSEIPTDSKCAQDANIMAIEISSKLKADEKAAWDLAYEKYYRDQVLKEQTVYHQFEMDQRNMDYQENQGFELQKMKINALRDVGVAFGNGLPKNIIFKSIF